MNSSPKSGVCPRRSATIPGISRRADPALTERRRAQLIRASYTEILEKGIQRVTLESVVARAGSSKGGALHYFRQGGPSVRRA
jgi:AcrR family transcriptional regulator